MSETDWMWCFEEPKEAAAEIDRLKAELEQVNQTNENIASIVDGYELCCCGNSIADHGYIGGHGPVSMLDHHVDCRVKERTAQLEQQLTTVKAALEQEEAHTTELCKELAEARAEIDKTYKTWCGRDYMHLPLSTAMGSVVAQARQEAASECIEAIEYEHGILGLAFTLRQLAREEEK